VMPVRVPPVNSRALRLTTRLPARTVALLLSRAPVLGAPLAWHGEPMSRQLLLRHPRDPAHLIEVDVVWPRSLWIHSPSRTCDKPSHTTASPAEAAAKHRRYRRRLAEAVRHR
jgi:hypothetical protein